MRTTLFCISDLHLGGAAATGSKPGFQMCPPEGQARLAAFLRWASGQGEAGGDLQLVLAGDVVDFLAEEDFKPFTSSDLEAEAKLLQVMKCNAEVFDALAAFVARKGKLTLMLGNHDIELSLPRTRHLLLARLGPGHVEFLYDNQAFTFGPVLIEHGNRYDNWNSVSHDELRRFRSRLSRGEKSSFEPLPGSEMVIRIVNQLKGDYSFVDLLKPETAALLPFLALLDNKQWSHTRDFLLQLNRAQQVRFTPGGQPLDEEYAAGNPSEDERLIRLADEMAAGGNPDEVGMLDGLASTFAERWKQVKGKLRELQLRLLVRALRAWVKDPDQAFAVEREDKTYLAPAAQSAAAGFKVVIYGHTHFVKRVSLQGGAMYLNTGTWADLMRMPKAILEGSDEEGWAKLTEFADALSDNDLEPWRTQLPTFARLELESSSTTGPRLLSADVHFFDGENQTPLVTTAEVLRRLEGGAARAREGT